ncbi:DUF6059 family protein [Streptomyces sp. NPDC059582]|uniref:DUF6059 family protein n=1 Tax=Streptomyces sp. NPDC059582 TaxID=3346875 RepID=UPI003692BEFA
MQRFRRNPWWIRHLIHRCGQLVWTGLVAFGAHHLNGHTYRPAPRLDRPPGGHPERLRPDQPLTELENMLVRELARRPWPHDPGRTGG